MQLKHTVELPHDKLNKITCAPSDNSDQPVHPHPPSPFSLRCPHEESFGSLTNPLSAQRSLRLDWADDQADLSLLGAHANCFFFFFFFFLFCHDRVAQICVQSAYCPHS